MEKTYAFMVTVSGKTPQHVIDLLEQLAAYSREQQVRLDAKPTPAESAPWHSQADQPKLVTKADFVRFLEQKFQIPRGSSNQWARAMAVRVWNALIQAQSQVCGLVCYCKICKNIATDCSCLAPGGRSAYIPAFDAAALKQLAPFTGKSKIPGLSSTAHYLTDWLETIEG